MAGIRQTHVLQGRHCCLMVAADGRTYLATCAEPSGEGPADLQLVRAGVGLQGLGICVDGPKLHILCTKQGNQHKQGTEHVSVGQNCVELQSFEMHDNCCVGAFPGFWFCKVRGALCPSAVSLTLLAATGPCYKVCM